MAEAPLHQVCEGCGLRAPAQEIAFTCADRRPADDIDHLLAVCWNETRRPRLDQGSANPFVAFRAESCSHAIATAFGIEDEEYIELVQQLDEAVASVDGHGFRTTPFSHNRGLGLWIKNETLNVSGTHKARHLFGLALCIEVAERTGALPAGSLGSAERPLAIASCGNAALAAAVVARAWKRHLRVFIPPTAPASVVARLTDLGASIKVCQAHEQAAAGDPCLEKFRAAVAAGAVPFTCQGSENGLTLEGGLTLGFELARSLALADAPRLEHLFVQVGGGALFSSTARALKLCAKDNAPLPALHAVQTEACQPLVRAWRTLARDLWAALVAAGAPDEEPGSDREMARWLLRNAKESVNARVFAAAGRQRGRYMQTVPGQPTSVASGILDNETYDGFAVLRAQIETGGWPVVVSEADLVAGRDEGRVQTGLNLDATGAAGLAAALAARQAGDIAPEATCAVLLTGTQR